MLIFKEILLIRGKIMQTPDLTPKEPVNKIWIPQTIIILMLCWAFYPDNPYGYYILLRWVCCAVFIYLAIHAWDLDKKGLVWVFGIIAAVYNPIIRIHSTREMWSVVNLITIVLAIYSMFILKKEIT